MGWGSGVGHSGLWWNFYLGVQYIWKIIINYINISIKYYILYSPLFTRAAGMQKAFNPLIRFVLHKGHLQKSS